MNLENFTPSIEAQERTVAACAWLVGIAQFSVDHHGLSPDVVCYLEALGSGVFESLNGGMGGMPPMQRSATDQRSHDDCVCRERQTWQALAVLSRLDQPSCIGGEVLQ